MRLATFLSMSFLSMSLLPSSPTITDPPPPAP